MFPPTTPVTESLDVHNFRDQSNYTKVSIHAHRKVDRYRGTHTGVKKDSATNLALAFS